MKKIIILFFLTTFSLNSQILSEKNRAVKINEILKNRFQNVLPELMDKTGIDMWILISREYNEDPVLKTMLPAEWLNARRRTILVFYSDKENNSLDKLAVARYNFGENIIELEIILASKKIIKCSKTKNTEISKNSLVTRTYLSDNNFNYRVGGKLLLLSLIISDVVNAIQ